MKIISQTNIYIADSVPKTNSYSISDIHIPENVRPLPQLTSATSATP